MTKKQIGIGERVYVEGKNGEFRLIGFIHEARTDDAIIKVWVTQPDIKVTSYNLYGVDVKGN